MQFQTLLKGAIKNESDEISFDAKKMDFSIRLQSFRHCTF